MVSIGLLIIQALMGKILCECGCIHSDTCGYDGHLFEYDSLREEDDSIYPLSVFECQECGNLMIDNPKDPKTMISFKPTNGKYNKILHDR